MVKAVTEALNERRYGEAGVLAKTVQRAVADNASAITIAVHEAVNEMLSDPAWIAAMRVRVREACAQALAEKVRSSIRALKVADAQALASLIGDAK
jgi:hypothetical protein